MNSWKQESGKRKTTQESLDPGNTRDREENNTKVQILKVDTEQNK